MIRILRQYKDKPDHYKILIYNDKKKLQKEYGEYFSYDSMLKGLSDSEYLFDQEKKQTGYQFTIFDL